MSTSQSYANHARIVPLYHYVLALLLLVNLVWRGVRLAGGVTGDTVVDLLVAIALILIAFFARAFALVVQDRVIRLEMRLRLLQVLPADLHPRISDFTVEQLVGLRFAGDAELPELAARVLRDGIGDRKTIKKLVTDWRADDLRV